MKTSVYLHRIPFFLLIIILKSSFIGNSKPSCCLLDCNWFTSVASFSKFACTVHSVAENHLYWANDWGYKDMEVAFKKYNVDTIFEVFPPLRVKPPLMAASRLVSPAYQGGSSTSPPYLRSPCSRWAQSCYSGLSNSVPIFKMAIFKTN